MALIPGSRGLVAFTAVLVLATLQFTGAYDPLDPFGNIAVKWDIMSFTGDGYNETDSLSIATQRQIGYAPNVAVSMYNTQQFRSIEKYHLGWTWDKNEVIWDMKGAQATQQGDCSALPAPYPHSCLKTPDIIDLVPGVPYARQVANCCRNGVISALAQDPANAVSSFVMYVGKAGNNNVSIKIPTKLTLHSPGPGYTCSDLKNVAPTRFPLNNELIYTRAALTWNATCTYSENLAQKVQLSEPGLERIATF